MAIILGKLTKLGQAKELRKKYPKQLIIVLKVNSYSPDFPELTIDNLKEEIKDVDWVIEDKYMKESYKKIISSECKLTNKLIIKDSKENSYLILSDSMNYLTLDNVSNEYSICTTKRYTHSKNISVLFKQKKIIHLSKDYNSGMIIYGGYRGPLHDLDLVDKPLIKGNIININIGSKTSCILNTNDL